MKTFFRLVMPAVLGVLLCTGSSAALALSLAEKAELQAAMQRHVDRQSIDGHYLALDRNSGDVRPLFPVTANPMILRMGERFVLCFDFRDEAGKDVDVDFYLARKGRSFTVFHAAVDDRQVLQRLMKAGKVVRAN